MFNKLRLLALTGAAVVALGLAPAVFADDGTYPGDYTNDLNARATADLTPAQASLQALQTPLDALVAQCFPGVSVVSTQVLPDRRPTYILVSVVNQDGSEAFDQKLDASFVSACTAGAGNAVSAAAVRVDGAAVLRDASMVLQDDLSGDASEPATAGTSTMPATSGANNSASYVTPY